MNERKKNWPQSTKYSDDAQRIRIFIYFSVSWKRVKSILSPCEIIWYSRTSYSDVAVWYVVWKWQRNFESWHSNTWFTVSEYDACDATQSQLEPRIRFYLQFRQFICHDRNFLWIVLWNCCQCIATEYVFVFVCYQLIVSQRFAFPAESNVRRTLTYCQNEMGKHSQLNRCAIDLGSKTCMQNKSLNFI